MQTFKDTATGNFYQFDDDVIADGSSGRYVFEGQAGLLSVPSTLVPASLADMPRPGPAVPGSVSRYQGREAMRLTPYSKDGQADVTLFDAFEALLQDPATPSYYRRAWEELLVFERKSPMLNAAADALGVSEAARDDLFLLASTLKA